MTGKQKWENFWYYYKVHVLVAIGIVVVGLVMWSTDRSAGPPAGVTVDVVGGVWNGPQAQLTDMENRAAIAVFGAKGAKHHGIALDSLPIQGNISNPTNQNYEMSLMAHIAAKSLDAVVLNPTDFRSFEKQHAFLKLTSIPGLSGVLQHAPGHDEYGIPLSAAKRLGQLLVPKGSMIGIIANTQNLDSTVAFIQWLYGQ